MTVTKRGGEIKVPGAQNGYDFSAGVAALSNGRSLVTWTEAGLRARSGEVHRDVHAQILDKNGVAVGGEIVISDAPFEQIEAQATGLSDGGFAVAWRTQTTPPTGPRHFEVAARFYDKGGVPTGAEIAIDTSGTAGDPQIERLADGSVVIVWTANDGSASGVYARHFSATGEALGDAAVVNAVTAGFQVDPAVTATRDGGYAVVWTQEGARSDDPTGGAVLLQRFGADGARVGETVTVASAIPSYPNASIAALTDGTFAVGYSHYDPYADVRNAFVVHLAADGTALDTAQAVSPGTAGHQLANAVVALERGGYLLAWTDFAGDRSGAGVRAQAFDSHDAAVGKAFLINTTTNNDQFSVLLDRFAGGRIVAAWTDEHRLGDGYTDGDVRAQLFDDVRAASPSAGMFEHGPGGAAALIVPHEPHPGLHGLADLAVLV